MSLIYHVTAFMWVRQRSCKMCQLAYVIWRILESLMCAVLPPKGWSRLTMHCQAVWQHIILDISCQCNIARALMLAMGQNPPLDDGLVEEMSRTIIHELSQCCSNRVYQDICPTVWQCVFNVDHLFCGKTPHIRDSDTVIYHCLGWPNMILFTAGRVGLWD